MSEHPGSMPSSPVTGLALKLSSAIITAVEHDRLSQLELSISVRVLGEFDIMLATTDESGEGAAKPSQEIPATEGRKLRINSILLSLLPGVIQLSGRSRGTHHDETAARSFTLTLTFSDGSATAMLWSTTFEVPHSTLADSRWQLTVPFNQASQGQGKPSEAN